MDESKCQVCLSAPKVDEIKLDCQHSFCELCLVGYLQVRVKDGDVSPKCFHVQEKGTRPCNNAISEEQLLSLVDEDTKRRYRRYRHQKNNPNVRLCPQCEEPNIGSSSRPVMICSSCGKKFCFLHDDAHPTSTCRDYEAANHAEFQLSHDCIAATTKPCPSCGSSIEKNGGCNQMRCRRCGCSFCWVCGVRVDDASFPMHFVWWNIRGCPSVEQQRNETPASRLCIRILTVLQVLVVGPFALAMTLVSPVLCCPCFVGMASNFSPLRMFGECLNVQGSVFIVLLLSPLFVIIALVRLCQLVSRACKKLVMRMCGVATATAAPPASAAAVAVAAAPAVPPVQGEPTGFAALQMLVLGAAGEAEAAVGAASLGLAEEGGATAAAVVTPPAAARAERRGVDAAFKGEQGNNEISAAAEEAVAAEEGRAAVIVV